MGTASIFEVKTHLSALVQQVMTDGEAVIITRHGKPVAKLVPYTDDGIAERRAQALAELRAAAKAAGIRYSPEEAVAPLPEDCWGVFAEPLPPRRVADGTLP